MVVDWGVFADILDVAVARRTSLLHMIGQSGYGDGWGGTNGHSTAVADLDRLAFE